MSKNRGAPARSGARAGSIEFALTTPSIGALEMEMDRGRADPHRLRRLEAELVYAGALNQLGGGGDD